MLLLSNAYIVSTYSKSFVMSISVGTEFKTILLLLSFLSSILVFISFKFKLNFEKSITSLNFFSKYSIYISIILFWYFFIAFLSPFDDNI